MTTPGPVAVSTIVPHVTAEMARAVAERHGVCTRPVMRRVLDQATGTDTRVAIPCGSTRASKCKGCAEKARRLRIQQCQEGWHRDTEPAAETESTNSPEDLDADPAGDDPDDTDRGQGAGMVPGRRVRSTRRRSDMPDLPRVRMEERTIGETFGPGDGREYRPSMFVTLTLPSYGKVRDGTPLDPGSYDYRRAALDAVLFARLVDRFFGNLRKVAGFKVQYFAAVEVQLRMAAHLHAALRGAIPRRIIKETAAAVYYSAWWPPIDQVLYDDQMPRWDGTDYLDPVTGVVLPTWEDALDQVQADSDARPLHVVRFGKQTDIAGIIAPSADADRAIRYLTKYLTKSIADTFDPDDDDYQADLAREAHIDRLHQELRWLPCGENCANWLRYGVQPKNPTPGLRPGRCPRKAHDRENLGLGGRRVLALDSGRERHWPSTEPTGRRWCVRPWSRRASSPPRLNAWPPPSPCPTVDPGSCGPTPNPTRSPTPK